MTVIEFPTADKRVAKYETALAKQREARVDDAFESSRLADVIDLHPTITKEAMTSINITYDEAANALGEVCSATDIDAYGNQVVVYRHANTTRPFHAAVLTATTREATGDSTIDSEPHALQFASALEMSHYISGVDANSLTEDSLPLLHKRCLTAGVAFPSTLLPLVALIEKEKESVTPEGRLRARVTEATSDGTKTLIIEGPASEVDQVWSVITTRHAQAV